jgi:hypothetical protein
MTSYPPSIVCREPHWPQITAIFIYIPLCCRILDIIIESLLLLHRLKGPEECLIRSLEIQKFNVGVT